MCDLSHYGLINDLDLCGEVCCSADRKLMAGIPCVAVIVENQHGEVLLQLREDRPGLPFANHWTLPGGRVEAGETPADAARRELWEELGCELPLRYWKVYERAHESGEFLIEQHVYTAFCDTPIGGFTIGEGKALRFVAPQEIDRLQVAYGFDALLGEYFAWEGKDPQGV